MGRLLIFDEFAYPSLDQAALFGAVGGLQKTALWRRSIWYRWRAALRQRQIEPRLAMALVGKRFRPLVANDMPLIVTVFNEGRFIASFLKHYRGLGVTRFIVVDDGSSDGSRERLLAEADVDLWQSDMRYGAASMGLAWRNWLSSRYGRNRWYVSVDADEYLVYPGSDAGVDLDGFRANLVARDCLRCPAPMIDAYHPGRLRDAVFDGTDDRMPWEVATHIDGGGYVLEKSSGALNVRGGARMRGFGSRVVLMKYPFFLWDSRTSLGDSIHRPLPLDRNCHPVSGILLHFKLFSDLKEKSAQLVADNQHFAEAREYRRFLAHTDIGNQVMACDHSIPFRGAADLVRRGFMVD